MFILDCLTFHPDSVPWQSGNDLPLPLYISCFQCAHSLLRYMALLKSSLKFILSMLLMVELIIFSEWNSRMVVDTIAFYQKSSGTVWVASPWTNLLERNIFLEGDVLTQKEISSHIKNVFMYLTSWYWRGGCGINPQETLSVYSLEANIIDFICYLGLLTKINSSFFTILLRWILWQRQKWIILSLF